LTVSRKKSFISISITGERVFLSIEVRMISVGWEWVIGGVDGVLFSPMDEG
jgi:hypothetical protein